MNNKSALPELWHRTLDELEQQTTKATFDTWIKPTFALALTGDVLVIGVRNAYAQQWLENRLCALVERTAAHVFGQKLQLRFELRARVEETAAPQPDDVIVDLIESPLKPFIFVQKYAIWFWQPFIGSIAFSTWLMLRTLDKVNEGRGKKHRLSVDIISRTLDCHRHTVTGRRPGELIEGAFGKLNEQKLARIEAVGRGHDTIYWARVLNSVPLLTPAQVEQLPRVLRLRHGTFLKDFSVDAERWEQLAIPTLITD